MRFQKFFKSASILGLALLIMSAGAFAGTIDYNTSDSEFDNGLKMLTSDSGAAATITFDPQVAADSAVPSNISLGNFTLACPTCTLQEDEMGATFDPFTFYLIVNDTTDVAVGQFVGTSAGGTIYTDSSSINIYWAPLELGPGTKNAQSGDFGNTIFRTTVYTGIVAPNTGGGESSVEGSLDSPAIPEPGTMSLVGGALLGLGLLRRKFFAKS